jgi:hypothetical protein
MRLVRLFVPAGLVFLLSAPAGARQAPAAAPPDPQVERRVVTAPVIVDGVRLFIVQAVTS